MNPEYARYQFLLSIFNSAFTVAAFVFAWWRTREQINDRRFSDINKKLVDLDKELSTLKSTVVRMEETDKHITARLDGIERLLAKIDGRFEGVNRMVDLLTQNELSGGKKE